MGVTIRHYFNSRHAGSGNPTWTWAATAFLFIAIMGLSTAPMFTQAPSQTTAQHQEHDALAEEAVTIIQGRCAMCHAREPNFEGLLWPPKGVILETAEDITRAAPDIYLQAAITNAMPPANITYMQDEERRIIARWVRATQAAH